MKHTHCLGRVLLAAIGIGLTGCAATTVQPRSEQEISGLASPTVVLVYPFGITADDVTTNQGVFARVEKSLSSTPMSEAQRQTAWDVSNRLADDLVTGINGLGLYTQRGSDRTVVPPGAVVISGAFVDVNEGNRAKRLVIGFGAGESTVDTRMRVMYYTGDSYRTLAEYTAHADSGNMPGAAVTMGAGAAAQGGMTAGLAAANAGIGGVKAHRSSMDPMIDRLADKSVASLSQLFAAQGWIPAAKIKTTSW